MHSRASLLYNHYALRLSLALICLLPLLSPLRCFAAPAKPDLSPAAQRYHVELQTDWFVSPSAKDAALAALGTPYQPAALEYAADKENYPLKSNLPAPPSYGRRDANAPDDAPGKGNGGRRVPSRFLSYARLLSVPASWAGHTVFLDSQ